ncbi:acetolactate synthase large subunit [bacterium]|nr:acetolactate synthase large subunit [bacterium]
MKASDLFVKCLETEGIELIFGVPGEENADFMISLEDSDKIRFILTRHEQGAAFMAEVYGRLTGTPAGCLGTLGPGATNLITGVADANMDRAPMLVLTGQGSSERLHKESHQVMDVVAMFKPVTKWAQMVYHADNIPEIVRKAVRLARTEKPGACLIELPEDIAKNQTKVAPIEPRRFRRPVADDKIVDRAWDAIRSARKPIILAGNGCIRRRASKQLRCFVEKTGIFVLNTMMAKGALDMDDPRCGFTIGLGAKDVPAVAIEEADLVISLGYDMVEYHPNLWNPPGSHRIVHCDFIPSEIDEDYRIEVEVIGDLAHTLWMLNERVDAYGPENLDFDHSHGERCRTKMIAEFEAHKDDATVGKIRPQKALWDARQVLGPNDLLLSDVGAHKMWIARYYQCHEPNTCLIPNGFCSMGFALPGAIAAHFVNPDQRIMAICGDAGFLMNVQEMETARRYNSNITVMIWEDHSYGLIAWKQDNHFGRHTDLSFGNPDFVKLAESFGWNGYRCENSADLRATLEESFQADGPSLVVIPIDYAENSLLTRRMGELTASI